MTDASATELFRFTAEGMPDDTFHVVSFRGTEALSSLFEFEIELVSRDFSIDLGMLLSGKAVLTVRRAGAPDAVFAGRPAAAFQKGHFGDWAYYSVTLRPAFWKFTQIVQSTIYLDKTAPEAVEEIFESEQLYPLKREMRLSDGGYPKQEFAMQHQESLYDYITWRMEQQGAYFYFAADGDTIIFSDTPRLHDHSFGTLYYSPASGLENGRTSEVVTSFTLCQTPLPARVVVRGVSWKTPNSPIVEEAPVSAHGFGDVYLAHQPVETHDDAKRIAKIRAEEILCRGRTFAGTSASPIIRPGAMFTLDRHYNPAFNREYMVTEVRHEGAQETFISLGLGIPIRDAENRLFYHNEFQCVESDAPYRPERKAPRAKITGVMRAFIDGAGSGARAERDSWGRYKVAFPFDVSGRSAGNASCWIRMSQLQAGSDSGFALPVQPGVEALVAFEEGDPDRPYISGVLANEETGSISGSGNQNISGLRSAGGNQITINDEDNKQGIAMTMPTGNGIMMSAGSSDLTASSTDIGLRAASIGTTDLAALFKDTYSGFLTQSGASSEAATLSAFAALSTAIGTMGSDILSSLSQSKAYEGTTAEGIAWGADGAKALGQVFNTILSRVDAGKSDPGSYGMQLTSSEKSTSSLIQVRRTTAQLVTLWLSLVARAASTGVDIPAGVQESKSDRKQETVETEEGKPVVKTESVYYKKDYSTTSNKMDAVRSFTISSAASLLPEITSIIVLLLAAHKQENKLGGIRLLAKDENINVTAKRGITQHAGDGILLHAGTIPDASSFAVDNSLMSMDVARKILANKDENGPGHWGVGLGEGESIARPLLKNDRTFLKTQNYDEGRVPAMDETPNTISSVADMVYSRAGDTVSVSVTGKIDHAGKFIVQSTGGSDSPGAATVMEPKKWAACVPGDGTVTLGVTEDGVKADRAETSKLSGLYAKKDAASLTFKDSGNVEVKDKSVNLNVKGGPTLKLNDKNAEMTADTISLKSGSTEQVKVNSSSVALCGGQLKFQNTKISGAGTLQLDSGVIKIG